VETIRITDQRLEEDPDGVIDTVRRLLARRS
jgi:hypothetical protein